MNEPKTRPPEERFWAKVDRRGPDECWPWLGAADTNYDNRGRFWDGKRMVPAPRFALESVVGPIGALFALHGCDNANCVNPAHLRPGTPADNMHDASARGTLSRAALRAVRLHPETVLRGERHPAAKLTDSDVFAIRRLVATTSRREIAERYGVCVTAINRIISRRSWSHLKELEGGE